MANPYQPPGEHDISSGQLIQAPATALMVVSSIAIVAGVFGLILDLILIVTGVVGKLEAVNEGPISEYAQIAIRATWGLILVIASSYVLFGSNKMRNLTDYSAARNASIIAMVPMIGPCCILGIPFGIWAFITLRKPGVEEQFLNR